jgi:hypothetical protein
MLKKGMVYFFLYPLVFMFCSNIKKPSMTIDEARDTAEKALPFLTDLQEPLSPNWMDYQVEDIADIDSDGIFEVALIQQVEGSMGYIGGNIFRLEGGRLVYIQSSRKLGRSQGTVKFSRNQIVLTSPAWAPEDQHCCPTLQIEEIFKYDKLSGFTPISVDTTLKRATE